MTATADISAGEAMTEAEVRAALQGARVVFTAEPGSLDALANKLADSKFSARGLVIARGRPATPGRNGYFSPAFSVGIQAGHVDASGTIDFFDRELLKPVRVDECVGQLHPPVSGVAGKRVDGTELKVENVRALSLQIGPGVRQAPDGRLYAAIAGVIVYEHDRKIDVSRQYVHAGDVDLRSGDLDMQGALTVRGSVQHQFTVRATGDIVIQGSVDSGSVYGAGKLRVQGGVRGGETGCVYVEGDVQAGHAEGALIRSGGVLTLGSAVNCDLAAHKIAATRMIRGGTSVAEVSLRVQEAGAAHAGTPTLLAVAVPLERPICDVRTELNAHKARRALQRQGGVRAADERGKGGKAGRMSAVLAQKELELKAELAGKREQLLPAARIHVVGRLHPGVAIQIGAHCLQIDDPDTNVCFTWDQERRTIRREGKK